MKKVFGFLLTVFSFSGVALADFTRSQLESMSKETLIDIILSMQNGPGGDGDCTTYNPANGERGIILTVVQSSGWDNGTFKWPNGAVFLKRSSGWDNGELYYPNGATMHRRSSGWDNLSIFWPNGNIMRVNSSDWDNGQIHHSDGSVWLRRSSGWDNGTRYGLPVDTLGLDGMSVRARLTDDDHVVATTIVEGNGWSLEVTVNGKDNSLAVKECFD